MSMSAITASVELPLKATRSTPERITMAEVDPDRLPISTDPSGLCPRCGHLSNFALRTSQAVTSGPIIPASGVRPLIEFMAVLECFGCQQCTVVIQRNLDPAGVPRYEGIHWWPAPGATDLDPEVPEPVGSAFSEGMRALSANCPRAAAVMFRGMLATVVQDKGSDAAKTAPNLHQQLKAMEQEGALHPSLVEWATEIRLVGNAGAHFDELAPVDRTEAADLARLCRQLITTVYETPARIRRARRPQRLN
jgi:hypothetical protein